MKKMIMLALVMALTFVLVNLRSIIEGQVAASEPASKLPAQDQDGSRNRISARAAGQGTPWVNLRNSYEVQTVYRGAGHDQLAEQELSPSAFASGDYDEDGVPDLIAGYAGNGGGVITLHYGNVDAIYPNSPEAQQRKATGEFTESAFLPLAEALEIEEAADFLGAGDFDADSHWDVVTAARGGGAVYLLPGDGRGGFAPSRRLELPGRVTALVAGEINRADGLADVVVAIVGAEGPKVLVFEGPEGALRNSPETFTLPARAEALALGHLDADYTVDLAVGAGSEVLIVSGRDRKLSLDMTHQAEVPQAALSRHPLRSAVASMAVGDFRGDSAYDLAVALKDGSLYVVNKGQAQEEWKNESLTTGPRLPATGLVCARMSGVAKDDLVIANRVGRKLHVLTTSDDTGTTDHARLQSPAYSMSSVELELEDEPIAVLPMRLNPDGLSDLVVFKRGHSSPTIVPSAPPMTFVVNSAADDDDGACDQAPGDCTLREAINAANGNSGPDTIDFQIGTGSQTINVTGSSLPIINSGPLSIDGTTQPGFAGTPIIELNGSGAGAFENGLTIDAAGCTVRGLVINRFPGEGIRLFRAQNSIIEGNFIGTDTTGTVDLGNNASGVGLQLPITGLTIGGTTVQARNLISGNNVTGIFLNDASDIVVQGNFIGTDITGTVALGNGFLSFGAVNLDRVNNSVIGGMTAGAGNLISGNNNRAVQIGGSGNLVQGNIIGLNISGASSLGNFDGVILNGSSNTVGGTATAARNIISSNNGDGVNIAVGNLNFVQGNYIGSDASGTLDRGNTGAGVRITAPNTTTGGTVTGAGNVISGNGQAGVFIGGQDATGNQVQGNFIGTQADGLNPLGNGSSGVGIGDFSSTFASNNTIGGTGPGVRNRIGFNGGDGVIVAGGTGNAIRSNSIFSNTELGIDLVPDGVTQNDSCDPDTGANNLQNFPVLTSAITLGLNTTIQGTLNGAAGTLFTVDFYFNQACDGSGNGEGLSFLGSTMVTNDGSCNAIINTTFTTVLMPGLSITATATDPAGNTSEFSQCIQSTVACTIGCPPNQTVSTGPSATQCAATVNYPAPPTTGGGCGTVTCTPPSGSSFPVGVTTVTCAAAAGPSCTFRVTVIDDTLPTIACPANITTSAASGQCSAAVNYTTPVANDNCGGATVDCSPPSGSTFPSGTNTVSCTAIDASKNTVDCSFTITVNPNLIITPTSRNHPATGGAGTVAVTAASGCSWTAVSNDAFITITSGASGTGNGTVGYSVAVNPGATRTGTMTIAGQTFTVTQDGAPACTVTCPANITVNTGQGSTACGAVVNYPPPAITGGCGMVTCAPTSGSFVPVGTTTVNCTTTAGSGCSFTVTVVDNTPPSITCPANINATISPGAACGAVNYPAPTVNDNCTGVTVSCSPASGSCFPRGTTIVTCVAADSTGNTSSCGFMVNTFDICLEDVSDSSMVLLINSATGSYLFCHGPDSYSGTGTIKRKGLVYTLEHNTPNRRVLAKADAAVNKGEASLQSPPGTTIWTIRDTNLRNNSCVCGNGP